MSTIMSPGPQRGSALAKTYCQNPGVLFNQTHALGDADIEERLMLFSLEVEGSKCSSVIPAVIYNVIPSHSKTSFH